ncbi:MAG: DUF494 domain-containing protein [Firmicutes bacterium]|nr:DUF494 domain-containing protein [Bacillota bacterium]
MEKVIEIVNFVIRQIFDRSDQGVTEQDLIEALIGLGYSPQEIKIAFKILCSLPSSIKTRVEAIGKLIDVKEGVRIFSQEEQKKLSISCQAEIIRLRNYSLITLAELEEILGNVVQNEFGEVGLKELEKILHKVIADEERLLMILPHPAEASSKLFLN